MTTLGGHLYTEAAQSTLGYPTEAVEKNLSVRYAVPPHLDLLLRHLYTEAAQSTLGYLTEAVEKKLSIRSYLSSWIEKKLLKIRRDEKDAYSRIK